MKTTIIRHLVLPFTATIMAAHSPAQTDMKNEVATSSYHQVADKMSFSHLPENAAKSTASVPYNRKVFQEFQKKFLDATKVSWSLERNSAYHAFFLKGGDLNAILFNKNGKIIYLISYLSADQLPSDVKNLINDNYQEYKITSAAKILQDNHIIWDVTLTGVTHFVTVVVEDGEIQQTSKYQLAN